MSDRLTTMELVFEITRRFASSLDLNEVLAQVLSLTVDTLGADHGSIFLFDQNGRASKHILARHNLGAEESEQIVTAVMDKGLAGWAVSNRQVALVKDTRTDPRWHHFPDDEIMTGSAVAVPLLYRERLNGLLTLMHQEPHAFAQTHLDLVSAIAGQAAVAVENARLFTHVRDERAVLKALIGGVQDPIIVTDAQHRVRYTNPAARALDATLEQAVGQPLEAIVPSERLSRLFARLLRTGQPQQDEIPWLDERTFDANLTLVPGVGSVAVLHDVSHFKELDRMKSEFVATVSHDLKCPLTVIYGHVELLKETLQDLDELAQESLKEIRASAVRMQNLITNLLDLAQIESGLDRAARPCQMEEIILDIVNEYLWRIQDKDIKLKIDIADDLPTIAGHPVQLGQAVSNLISNALKYTPAGGQTTISAQVSDQNLIVQISDTGPGIPSARQKGLFGKFYRVGAKETRDLEGHGLGLAIVRSVVETHGGRVWVTSAIGQGSTFGFSLPIPEEQE